MFSSSPICILRCYLKDKERTKWGACPYPVIYSRHGLQSLAYQGVLRSLLFQRCLEVLDMLCIQMTILSQLQNRHSYVAWLYNRLFRNDHHLYRYLNARSLTGPWDGSPVRSNHYSHLIYWLPVELWVEIFSHCIQTTDRSRWSSSLCVQPFSQTTPFYLGQVCHHWRSIVLSAGGLWQSMYIESPRLEQIPLIRLWLSRAGDYPLSIWLFQSVSPSDSEIQATNEVLSLLVARLHRWKTINFSFPVNVPQALSNMPHGAATVLESACIRPPRADRAGIDNLWRALHSSPTICRPNWEGLYRSEPPKHAPWDQLTHINLEGQHSCHVVLGVLQHCQRVVDLTLSLISSETSIQIPPFVLPHLRHLRMSSQTELRQLFQGLVLPSLFSLDLVYRFYADASRSFPFLGELMHRSQCELNELTLHVVEPGAREDAILNHLRIPAMGSLVELKLYNTITDRTINFLAQKEGGERLPNLQVMSLECCTQSDGVFSDMVIARLPCLRIIRAALLRTNTHSYRRDRANVRTIRKTGCDIEVDLRS